MLCIGETIKTFLLLNKCEARDAAAANAPIGSGNAVKKREYLEKRLITFSKRCYLNDNS